MASFEWYLARRYLASRRQGRFLSLITLIAIGGVFVGVAALITVIAVMTGLQQDLQAKILGSNPHIYVFEQGRGWRMDGWEEVLSTVRDTEGVITAGPFILTQVGVIAPGGEAPASDAGAVDYADYAQFGTLYGIDPDATQQPLSEVEARIRSGDLALGPTTEGRPGVLIGVRLARRLGVLPGDEVPVASLENIRTDPMGMPQLKSMIFEVTGTFETGMYEYDNQNLYVELDAARELLDFGDDVSGIAANIEDPWRADEVASRLRENLGYPYYTNDWIDLNQALFSALQLEKLAMGLILFLIVLVAAFNIISTLIMVVTDKTREIGILKSMGVTDGRILRIFMLQGLTIGMIGTFLGTLGGLGLVWLLDTYQFIELPGDVYFLDSLPVALNPGDLALIVVLSIVVSFGATIYPALQASRLLPVDAIRHE